MDARFIAQEGKAAGGYAKEGEPEKGVGEGLVDHGAEDRLGRPRCSSGSAMATSRLAQGR